jgi:hypothetical protein
VKQLVLLAGALYFTIVALTNAINFIGAVAGDHWVFLDSGNAGYIASSVTKVYAWPGWFDKAAVLAATAVEGVGAFFFWKALFRFRGGGAGVHEAWLALAWNIAVWVGFIIATEFFTAYPSESTFRELLAIALLMAIVIAVVPDNPGTEQPPT